MHFVDLIIVATIGLIIFGPKALQSMARSAGRGAGQMQNMKDKFMAELPMDEITQLRESIPHIPLNSHQAVDMLLSSKSEEPAEPLPDSSKESERKVERPESEIKREEVR